MQVETSNVDVLEPLSGQNLVDKTVLQEFSYYHGMIPAQDVSTLLEKDGDFLLREELLYDGVLVVALSVRCGDFIKHFMVNRSDDGEFYIESIRAKTIKDLIQKHLVNGEPLSKASQAMLRRPIPRQEWMLNHEDIIFIESLGKHHYVEEFVGEFVQNNVTQQVFLKTLGISCDRDVLERFLKEARLLRSLQHENIGLIYGIALHNNPIILVLEFFSTSLLTYLKRNRGRTSMAEKRRFVCEAAAGLAYLADSGCIHRDIAARNCMLTDSLVVKISGFSLSEPINEMHDSSNIAIAVKWQAPEVLKNLDYSLKSDVWSFGVLVWEVYSDGAEPYDEMTPNEVKEVILKDDYRMTIPEDCPKVIAKIIESSWESYPRKRPCMSAIHLVIRDC